MRILIIGKPDRHAVGRLAEAGESAGHTVFTRPVTDVRFEVRTERREVFIGEEPLEKFDVMILWGFYPYFSEALMLAEWAASLGIRVVDRALAEENFVKSKTYDAWRLAEAGLPVPDSVQVMDMRRAPFDALRWPAVAKGVHGSQGKWVFKVDSIKEARRHLHGGLVGLFIFQEFLPIEEEYRVVTVGGRALGAVRKNACPDDFRRNFSLGNPQETAEIPASWTALCEQASRVLKAEIAGVDLAVANGNPYILEVNRRPGFEGFENATGINVAEHVVTYVTEMQECEKRQVRNSNFGS